MDTTLLKQWVVENNIEKRTIDDFWQYLEYYKDAVPEEYTQYFGGIDFRFITLEFKKVSLTTIYSASWDIVSSFLDIKFKGHDIGTYETVFTLSGEIQDNFLSMEDRNYIHLLSCLEIRNVEVAQAAIDEGAEIEFIEKITGLSRVEIEELIEYRVANSKAIHPSI